MSTLAREALALIEQFEGYLKRLPDDRAAPYLCPANVPTIGWGTTFYEDRRKVALSDPPITRDRARELLAFELRECEAAVDRLTTRRLDPLSRGALVSFAYNAGTGAYRGSGLRRAVNAGDDTRAAAEFKKWRLGGGVVLKGLERRRLAEAALYLKGVRNASLARPGAVPDDHGWRTIVIPALVAADAAGARAGHRGGSTAGAAAGA